MSDTCDLCKGGYLVEKVHPIGRFRNVRNLCIDCGMAVETIRSKHAYDAYKYGKKDWYERLCINVRNELKKLYRRKAGV
jgi:hypothetical protein